ncbi:MAG: MMPL family transporter, partial [Deltaproteobacteria bacterium]|nr:MMPL family transporter [Deltaproteobacteria bacterium]
MTTVRSNMEKWFASLARTIYRNRLKTLFIMAVLIAAIATQIPKLTIDISMEGFLHKTAPTLIEYNNFRDQFGRDEVLIVEIRSPEIFEDSFLERLKRLHEDLRENVPYIEDITSLINARNTRGEKDELIVEDLLENWPKTPEEIALIRQRTLDNPLYKNLLISEDSKMTTIVIQTQAYSSAGVGIDVLEGFEDSTNRDLKDAGKSAGKKYLTDKENSEVVHAVNRIAEKYKGPDIKIYIAGLPSVTHFIKQSMVKDVRRFLVLSFVTIAVLLFIMFRRVTGVVLPLLIVVLSLVSTIGLMAAFKAPIKLPTQILPSFILAVSVGYSVHILSIFYQSFLKSGSREEAIVYSIGHSGLAVVMTAATTAGGLFSFSTSEVAPIADVGIFAGSGVLLAMVYTIILLPALLAIIPIRTSTTQKDKSGDDAIERLLKKVGLIATGHPYKILVILSVIMVLSIVGAMKIHFSHDVLKWLPKENSSRIATEKIDKELRGSVNMAIIIDTGKENGLYDPDILNRIEKTAAYLEALEVGEVFAGKAWSLTTILKETNRALHENRQQFYAIPQNRN